MFLHSVPVIALRLHFYPKMFYLFLLVAYVFSGCFLFPLRIVLHSYFPRFPLSFWCLSFSPGPLDAGPGAVYGRGVAVNVGVSAGVGFWLCLSVSLLIKV